MGKVEVEVEELADWISVQKRKSETRVEDGGKIFSADGTGSSESSGFSGFVSQGLV